MSAGLLLFIVCSLIVVGGLVAFAGHVAYTAEDVFEWVLAGFLLVLAVGAGVIAYGIYDSVFVYHETFALRTDEWSCTDKRTTTTMMPMRSGNVTMMVPQTHTYCIEYTKKGY